MILSFQTDKSGQTVYRLLLKEASDRANIVVPDQTAP